MRRVIFLLILSITVPFLWGQSFDITQIENRRLLFDGTLDLFFLPRDAAGEPRDLRDDEAVQVFRKTDEGDLIEQEIVGLEQEAPEHQGINFLLLIDNSGSMHQRYLGDETRYETAAYAVDRFLDSIDNPLDTLGISVFNTYYTPLSPVSGMSYIHRDAIEGVSPPADEEAFTELYHSMLLATEDLSPFQGRRAMIVLSDGENYPFALSGKENPRYGDIATTPEEVIGKMLEEGISVYAVHIGTERDPMLNKIVMETGGRSFDADSREALSAVYGTIRNEIRREYRVRFRPDYSGRETNALVVRLGEDESGASYYVPYFLGVPSGGFRPWFIIPALIAVALALLTVLFVWERGAREPEINILKSGKPFSQATRVFLTKDVTVIGSGNRADMTIAGNPALKESHATIVHSAGGYTVQAGEEFRVNNHLTRQHQLKSGDVIDFNGTVVVFDEPDTSG